MGQLLLWIIHTGLNAPAAARRTAGALLAAVLALAAVAGAWAGALQLAGNFHEVVPGEFYRSRQPSAERLVELVASHGIRTVINLRGEKPGEPWYEAEKAVLAAEGVTFVSFPWSDRREPRPEEIADFVRTVSHAQKPILVHCKAGADRAGLASALYLAFVKGADYDAAEWQLSFRYGHVALPVSAAYPMTIAFRRLRDEATAALP